MENIKLVLEVGIIGIVIGYFLKEIAALVTNAIKEFKIAKKEWNKSQ